MPAAPRGGGPPAGYGQRIAPAHRVIAAIFTAALALSGQQTSGLTKAIVAGRALASQFGRWRIPANGPVAAGAGPQTVVLDSHSFTLPDGTAFEPLAVGTPIEISGDGHPEVVTPTAVNCSVGGAACTFAAVFAYPHPGHVTVSSGTLGVQEAIDYMSGHGGGIVQADAGLQGSFSGVLALLKLPPNVMLVDATQGQLTYYGLGNGGEPQVLASISSGNGLALGALSQLNGAVFASTHNFAAVAPGGTLAAASPATVTPAWSTLPSGVIAGDSLYLSGGNGPAEVVTLTNTGSACPGGGADSVCFTPAGGHSGAWSLSSATAGLQEAVNAAGAGGWVIDDAALSTIRAPLILTQTVRLSGYSAMDAGVGSRIVQITPNADVIQVGTATASPADVVIENLMAVGVSGDGIDSGAAIHCLNCSKLKLQNVTGKQAHDGLYFDSSFDHAYDATVTGSHFIGDLYGVHIAGGSANRLTFIGNTVDGNAYGVFDDGGWVHTWIGNDIESNSKYGYWQQVSDPAHYSGRNVVLEGNYFENNGANSAGFGDVFLGQLVNGGAGNNGAGCLGCVITGNIFNASTGGEVTALNFGAVDATVSDNSYSGYGTGRIYAYTNGPAPNFSHVLSLGDGGGDTGATATSGAYGGARVGTITRIDPNGGLTLGGWDQLTDSQGSPIRDTVIESPTGNVSVRGVPGGAAASNPASLYLDGDSLSTRGSSITFRNRSVPEYQINNDPYGSNAHDFCLVNDLANPSQAQCLIYVNPQGKIKFGNPGPPGTLAARTQDYEFTQTTNGDAALVVNRATDSGSAGYLLDLEDATLSTPLFRIDTHGTVVAGNWNDSSSAMTVGALSATSGDFSGTVEMAAGSTVGGAAINSTAGRVSGQSGTLFSGATLTAGECLSGGIDFSSGVAIGMAVTSNPESLPPTGLVWNAAIDAANHVTIRVCNVTANPITWSGGAIWDVRILP